MPHEYDTDLYKVDRRNTDLYKDMTPYVACALAEGFGEGEDASIEDQLIAWQWIYDTGLWRHLQGWYGRTVYDLVDNNVIDK